MLRLRRGCARGARPLLAARSTQKSEMGKSQMEIGYERRFMLAAGGEEGRRGARSLGLALAAPAAAAGGDVRLQRVMRSAISEINLSSPRRTTIPEFAM